MAAAYGVSSTKRTAVTDETYDRRRVDPPAGCRAAAEPARLCRMVVRDAADN